MEKWVTRFVSHCRGEEKFCSRWQQKDLDWGSDATDQHNLVPFYFPNKELQLALHNLRFYFHRFSQWQIKNI